MNELKILKLYFIFYAIILFNTSPSIAVTQQITADTAATKILFFGNSFTGWNDMPSMVEELTNNSSHKIYVDDYLVYGRSLYEISQLDTVKFIIESLEWDYIILQDSPYRYAYPEEFSTENPLMDALYNFDKMVKANSVNTEIVLFMPWAYKDGKFWDDTSPDDYMQMQTKVYDNIILIAKELNYKIAPVGWAWSKVDFFEGGIELFSPDLAHPAVAGSYLTACVIYSSIFKEELSANPYFGEISKDIAEYLQSVASETVFSELENWNLLTNISANSISINSIAEFKLDQNFPNPFNPETTITFTLQKSTHVKLEIYNSIGEKIARLNNNIIPKGQYSFRFDANNLPNGIYYYRINTENFSETKKMILLK